MLPRQRRRLSHTPTVASAFGNRLLMGRCSGATGAAVVYRGARAFVLVRHTSVSVVLDRYGHLYPQHDLDLRSAMESQNKRRPAT